MKIEKGQKWRRKKDAAIIELTFVDHQCSYVQYQKVGTKRASWVYMNYLKTHYEIAE